VNETTGDRGWPHGGVLLAGNDLGADLEAPVAAQPASEAGHIGGHVDAGQWP